jgi:hypothetical protein
MKRMLALGELFADYHNEDQFCPVFMLSSRVDTWKWQSLSRFFVEHLGAAGGSTRKETNFE